ncbi:MAG: Abi family protein [Propionibacteriaceae bacterium]|nr:Abi family protein [Propionibacteriaceae bacterium]
MQTPPFLTPEQRVDYLYDKDYFKHGSLTEQHVERLRGLNFHYFLGYARNYRALVGRGQINVSHKSPDHVFGVIDMDTRVSALIHEGLRSAEWRLRAAAVARYCTKYQPANSYLQPTQYRATDHTSPERLVENILLHIYRHDEPYVDECLRDAAQSKGQSKPRRYESACHDMCLDLAADLPLWAVVDSFSLGLLGQFIMNCDKDAESPVWKAVAKDVEIGAQVFETQLKSLAYLRNSVAHHARLWMRPTSDSAKRPRLFKSRLNDVHHKSMYWAFMNLATFQPPHQRQDFARRIDDLTGQDSIYRHGITNVHQAPKTS